MTACGPHTIFEQPIRLQSGETKVGPPSRWPVIRRGQMVTASDSYLPMEETGSWVCRDNMSTDTFSKAGWIREVITTTTGICSASYTKEIQSTPTLNPGPMIWARPESPQAPLPTMIGTCRNDSSSEHTTTTVKTPWDRLPSSSCIMACSRTSKDKKSKATWLSSMV